MSSTQPDDEFAQKRQQLLDAFQETVQSGVTAGGEHGANPA